MNKSLRPESSNATPEPELPLVPPQQPENKPEAASPPIAPDLNPAAEQQPATKRSRASKKHVMALPVVDTPQQELADTTTKTIMVTPGLGKSLKAAACWVAAHTRGLSCEPSTIINEFMIHSGDLMADLTNLWALDQNLDLDRLRKIKEAAAGFLKELEAVKFSGEAALKIPLPIQVVAQLEEYAKTFETMFGGEFHARDVLERLWLRGGVLHVADLLKAPESPSAAS